MTIEEAIQEAVKKEIEPLRRELAALRQQLAPRSRYVTRRDIATELGRSMRWLFDRPWILPGDPDIKGAPDRWLRERWEAHRDAVAWRLAGERKAG